MAIGVPLLLEPPLIARRWLGPDEGGRRSVHALARGVGGRDAALALGLATALVRDEGVPLWLLAGAAADLSDLAAAVLAGDAMPVVSRRATIAIAAGSAIGGTALALAWND